MKLQTPILFLIFNRPDQTLLVFEEIRKQQPAKLFIAADGPRFNKPGEAVLCEKAKEAILQRIDWDCEVHTLFREHNLGCGKAVSSAIDWFFDCVEEGIILEDDCLPDPTFFSFCTSLLSHYRTDEKIMHISGTNYQMGIERGDGSYYFSRYTHIWGWASWRRAWKKYDFSMQQYKDKSREGLNTRLRADLAAVCRNEIDAWDIQWFMCVWFNRGWSIIPNTNLVRNIGYGKHATHTIYIPAWFKRLQYGSIPVVRHPSVIEINEAADRYSVNTLFKTGYLLNKVKKLVKSVLPLKLFELFAG
jgi:hypothetical protein